ncbi:MAG: VWA domain-containing protein [Anaerolineae bacterium]|nr:VWA domain-containing protein [Anaerolineae bacterium]
MKKMGVMFILAAMLLAALPASADGIIIPVPPPPGVVADPVWLTIRYHHVDIKIDNQVATTRVDQVFVNEGMQTAEGTYIFPLPKGATVNDFVMWVDGKPIEAKILEKEEARRIYDDIVRKLRDPALLEYIGRDLVQANVFPIAPGEERRIEMEYAQILEVDQGLVSYLYPLDTERFSARPLEEVAIHVEVFSNDDIGAIYSDTHDIAIHRDGNRHFKAGYEAYNVLPDIDFSLRYGLASDEVNLNLLTYRESATARGFFALLVAPPFEVEKERVIPRDIIVVLDQSGSMDGEKWDQAREAAAYVLKNLNPEDRFNLILFSTGWRPYAKEVQPPGEAQRAIDWISDMEAVGGTDINGALLDAMNYAGERPAVILFLTDGLATEGDTIETDEILANVKEAAPSKVRIFTFGVGYDVDTVLLDSLAQAHQGVSAYVRPDERIDDEVSSLYAKISAPVLSNVKIDFGDIMVEECYPQMPLSDLFAGTQMVIVGRYRDGGATTLTISGEVGGKEKSFVYSDLTFPRNAGGESFIPRLWATRRIGDLLNQIRLHGENPELVESIIALSVRYGIITPYTSYLITEDDIFTEDGRAEAASSFGDREFSVTGAVAVDESESMQDLAQANAPAAMPTMTMMNGLGGGDADKGGGGEWLPPGEGGHFEAGNVVKIVKAKTFAYRDGVWIDTEYDPDQYTTQKVVFFSDEYFALLDQIPELGEYLALGEQVIVVYNGVAYEVMPEA